MNYFTVVELHSCKEILCTELIFSGQVLCFFTEHSSCFHCFLCVCTGTCRLVLSMLVPFVLIQYRWTLVSYTPVSETNIVSAGYFVLYGLFCGCRERCKWERWKGPSQHIEGMYGRAFVRGLSFLRFCYILLFHPT